MRLPNTLVLLTAFLLCSAVAATSCLDRLSTSNFVDSVTCLSYPVETHIVTTEDGHKLTLYRIQAKYSKISPNKPVTLMWHGLIDSADGWIINEERIAPGLVMANKGYDVWFGNSRGNKYSLGHTYHDSTKDTEFWEFSWQHMAQYDLPAAFSYIAKLTGEKINYIGHSQGTTQMFAALSDPAGRHPAIINNLRKFAALGPVAYLGNVRSHLITTLARTPLLVQLLQQVGKYGVLMPNWFSSQGGRAICTTFSWTCSLGLNLVSDDKPNTNNEAKYDALAGHYPSGTSVMDLQHWKQALTNGGEFSKYDYGFFGNLQTYGQTKPPKYDVTLIQEDVGLFVGADDLLATPADVGKLRRDMVNAKTMIRYYPLGHLGFFLGKELSYMNDLLEFLDIKQ